MSEDPGAYVVAQSEPKSSIEIERVAASTPKGEPKFVVKRYYDAERHGAERDALDAAITVFTALEAWAATRTGNES